MQRIPIHVGEDAYVGPAEASTDLLNLTLVSGAGIDRLTGAPAVQVDDGARVTALIHAMNGRVDVVGAAVVGSITAQEVHLLDYSSVSGFAASILSPLVTVCTYPLVPSDGTVDFTPVGIDDGDPCTADDCDPTAGVTHTPIASGAPCSTPLGAHGACTTGPDGAWGCIPGATPVVPPPVLFATGLPAKDLTIAAGRDYILAGGNGGMGSKPSFKWFDRLGNQVFSIAGKDLFAPVLDVNRYNINAQAGFGPGDAITCLLPTGTGVQLPKVWNGTNFPCPPNAGAGPLCSVLCSPACGACPLETSCIDEVYESRVLHDDERSRWIIQQVVRNHMREGDPQSGEKCPGRYSKDYDITRLVRRHVVLAVSRTEDPAKSFKYYWMPHSYEDKPDMAINGPYLTSTWYNTSDPLLLDEDDLNHGA